MQCIVNLPSADIRPLLRICGDIIFLISQNCNVRHQSDEIRYKSQNKCNAQDRKDISLLRNIKLI